MLPHNVFRWAVQTPPLSSMRLRMPPLPTRWRGSREVRCVNGHLARSAKVTSRLAAWHFENRMLRDAC